MAGKGGKRPGAGRKSKSQEQDQAAFMDRNLPEDKRVEILNRMVDIAITSENLKAAVSAGSLLLAYALGKPTEKHEHGGANGGPMILKVVYESKRTDNSLT